MNDTNKKLFFNESDDETVVITISPEGSEEFDVEIIASMEIDELSQEYIAAMPTHSTDEISDDELILFRYSEDEDGNPEFEGITDDEELESVAAAFERYFNKATNELYNDENYLKDLGSFVPGVRIK